MTVSRVRDRTLQLISSHALNDCCMYSSITSHTAILILSPTAMYSNTNVVVDAMSPSKVLELVGASLSLRVYLD